jgi:hypothetical protein
LFVHIFISCFFDTCSCLFTCIVFSLPSTDQSRLSVEYVSSVSTLCWSCAFSSLVQELRLYKRLQCTSSTRQQVPHYILVLLCRDFGSARRFLAVNCTANVAEQWIK